MKQFVKAGMIVAYQLMQDDELSIGVCVGEPLTEAEMAPARWREPQKAFLRLPTGRLVIESNDALTIREEEPSDAGAELEVPPGDYLATLHRVDWEAVRDEGLKWTGPSEVITLTAGSLAKPVRGQPAILPWETGRQGRAKWTITEGVYQGVASVGGEALTLSVAIDRPSLDQIGLTDRGLAILSIPSLNVECLLMYIEGNPLEYPVISCDLDDLKLPRSCAGRIRCDCMYDAQTTTLHCWHIHAALPVPRKQRNEWHPASLRVLGELAR